MTFRRTSIVIALLAITGCNAAPMLALPQAAAVTQQRIAGSQAEAEARRIFDFTDANHDSLVSFKEMISAPTGQPVNGWKPGEKERLARETFSRMDTDRSGAISFIEFKAGATGQPMT